MSLGQETRHITLARNLSPETVAIIGLMHRDWLRDGEIAERLGQEPLTVWHARQIHKLTRPFSEYS